MVITEFIVKSCVIPRIASTNKSDALKELTHHLYDKKRMKDVALALDQIVAREATESTGIGNAIAVPHARIPGLKGLMCAIGRVPDGIDFLAVDRKPVKLIFLICYPPAQQTTYLNFVATVARILSNGDRLQSLLDASDGDEIFDLLETIAKSFDDAHEQSFKEVQADPDIPKLKDGHADLILLARLQLHQEMLNAAKTGKTQIKKRIDAIRALVEPRILTHYDKLMKGRAPALVPVEGDTCQGCFIRLPSKFVQRVRQDTAHIHTCSNCARYIYVV